MHHKRLTAAMFGAAIVAASLTASPAAAAPLRPEAIAGDSHSSAVATRAAETLASFDALTRAGGTTRLIRYIGDRNATADAVAAEFGLDAGAVRQAWSRAGHQHQIAVLAALSQLGVEYRSNSSEPGVSFDCSG